MKALLFLTLSFVFTLTACNPRDPEILSEEEKARKGRSGGNDQSSKRVQLPKNLELVLAEMVEARQTQLKAVTVKAQTLAANPNQTLEDGCEKTRLLKKDADTLVFKTTFPGKCQKQSEQFSTSRTGASELKLVLNEKGELASFELTATGSGVSPLTAYGTQVEKKGQNAKKMNLLEEISLLAEKQADGTFQIQQGSLTDSLLNFQDKEKPYSIQVIMNFENTRLAADGTVLEWSMSVEGGAWFSGEENKDVTSFGFTRLASQKGDSLTYDFTFQFNGSPRSGTLTYSEAEIVALTRNEKANRTDKTSRKRTKASEMPWDVWVF